MKKKSKTAKETISKVPKTRGSEYQPKGKKKGLESSADKDLKNLLKEAAEEIKADLPPGTRQDFASNHDLIISAYLQLLEEGGLIPSAASIARVTGLSHVTVQKHLKDFSFDRFRKRLSLSCVIAAGRLARKVTSPNPDAADVKTFFEIAGELKTKVEHSGRVDYRTLGEVVGEGNDTNERARRLAETIAARS